MLTDPKRKIEMLTMAGILGFAVGCVPTTDGEFSTGGQPTSTSAEKLALITGVSDGSILSIIFSPKAKQYLMIYTPKRLNGARLTAAEQRMCRYRKLTYDRVGKDAPLQNTNSGTKQPSPNPYEGARTRSFYCR